MSPGTLDRRTLRELERFLQDELARLEASLRATAQEHRTAEKAGSADDTVHAVEALDTEIRVTLVGRRTEQVAQIHDALQRLSEGRYGFCQECEAFVGVPRLRALPFARRCRGCQSHREQRAQREAAANVRGLQLPPELEAA
jgi:RNA polymerase-binding transcription factor